jgi:hypothetical protein
LVLLGGCADMACGPFGPNARPELVAQMFMGRRYTGGEVSDADWARFAAEVITPRFPDGFTVLDAAGQWRGVDGVVRESSKVLMVAAPDTAAVRGALAEISDAYKQRFHQQSVGLVITHGCAAF